MPHALIIDDNPPNAEVLGRLLSMQNVSSTYVADVSHLDQVLVGISECHVVFLDLEMPKYTGYEVLEYLRQRLGKNVPIVAYTVNLHEAYVARDNGFDSFLGKPIDHANFPSRLTRILNHEAVWEF